MQKSPSKFLSRKFLREIAKEYFVSPGGIEYSEEESRELLIEKEQRHAEASWRKELIEARRPESPLIDMVAQVKDFQDSILSVIAPEGTARGSTELKSLSTDNAPGNYSVSATMGLQSLPAPAEIVPINNDSQRSIGVAVIAAAPSRKKSQEKRRGKMKTFMGHEVIAELPERSLAEIKKELDETIKWMREHGKIESGKTSVRSTASRGKDKK